jgi:hypothetical protein
MRFSELVQGLRKEQVKIPADIARHKTDVDNSLFEIFVSNDRTFADGVQSNWERHTGGGFLSHEVGLRLLPYGLVKFDKLPAAQAKWFKPLVVSSEGHKFLLQVKRPIAKDTT